MKKEHIDQFVGGGSDKGGEKKMFRSKGKAVHGTFFGAKKDAPPSTRNAPEAEQAQQRK